MPNIEDLKKNATSPLDIDITEQQVSGQREAVSINAIAKETTDVAHADQDTLKDQLTTKALSGPESDFAKYVRKQVEEAHQYLEDKEEEKSINEEFDPEYDIDDGTSSSEQTEKQEENADWMQMSVGDIVAHARESTKNAIEEEEMENKELEKLQRTEDTIENDTEETSTITIPEKPEQDEELFKQNTAINKIDAKSALSESSDLDDNFDDEDDIDDIPTIITSEFDTDEDEEESVEVVEDSVESDEDDKEIIQRLKDMATEKLKPVSKKLDISSFTVIKKPISTSTALKNIPKSRAAKWVLFEQKAMIMMREFSGSELEFLRQYRSQRDASYQLKALRMIYDHVETPKPSTFESWLKSTPYVDLDNYFFAIYISSFAGANFIPMDCSNNKCNYTFLTDDVPVMDMVKFDKDNNSEKIWNEVMQSENINGEGLFVSEVVPINDIYAAGFRVPSLFDVIQSQALPADIIEKYSATLDIIPYIDQMYAIDINSQSVSPIGYKTFTDNDAKTFVSKLKAYTKIINTMTVDEFNIIKAFISSLSESKDQPKYVFPEITCPKCGKPIAEQETTAEAAVFTRHQLAALVNTQLR